LRRGLLDGLSVGRLDALDELRRVERAAVGDGRVGERELEQRHARVALADGRVERVPDAEAAEGLLVPLARREEAGRLAVDADARARAEPEFAGHAVDALEADELGHLVEVDVARADER